ncbi:uncharacterized protein LOC117590369 [Drosophila guanche]|uniref:uncharacterized protein LOC117590369 n=1 Tax=Drosophila guanche TaxID=7266 RepID=UPI001471567D|nr:uncharacterized protein LOC117590369 [Drosophila guanche]
MDEQKMQQLLVSQQQPQQQQHQQHEWLPCCHKPYESSLMAISLPETRTTSPHFEYEEFIGNIPRTRPRTTTAIDNTATTTPRTTRQHENEAMILSVPIIITTPVAIKKIYSDNDINYNAIFDVHDDWIETAGAASAVHHYHTPEEQPQQSQQQQQHHPHHPLYSYHTL